LSPAGATATRSYPGRDPRVGVGQATARGRPYAIGVISVIVLWTAIGLLAWVYLGYPILVAILARIAPWHPRQSELAPTVSVAIAVHDEAPVIAERIEDALAQAAGGVRLIEVLIGSDGSADETEPIVAGIAARDPRVRLLALPRGGQTATQDALFRAATADVIVLTDAETRFAPGCLARLAEAFRDPRVGAATGRLEWRNEGATATSSNEGLYWRYERRVRELESRAGCLTAVTGALLAVRRTSYRPVPSTASMDHLLPLYVRETGGAVVYVADALATDRPISGLREQFRNRSRTASRGIRANLSMVRRLAPWRRPRSALAIWSHKLLRWATPWLVLVAVLAGVVGAARGSWVAAVVVAAVVVWALAAGLGQVLASSGRRPPRPLAFARAFAIVNVAFARAWLDVVRGRRIEAWHRVGWEQPRGG
jgi:cellulose synthase/poly-beta-1,6-N-acetylglucosamine synthase-like glycosyltransferase